MEPVWPPMLTALQQEAVVPIFQSLSVVWSLSRCCRMASLELDPEFEISPIDILLNTKFRSVRVFPLLTIIIIVGFRLVPIPVLGGGAINPDNEMPGRFFGCPSAWFRLLLFSFPMLVIRLSVIGTVLALSGILVFSHGSKTIPKVIHSNKILNSGSPEMELAELDSLEGPSLMSDSCFCCCRYWVCSTRLFPFPGAFCCWATSMSFWLLAASSESAKINFLLVILFSHQNVTLLSSSFTTHKFGP